MGAAGDETCRSAPTRSDRIGRVTKIGMKAVTKRIGAARMLAMLASRARTLRAQERGGLLVETVIALVIFGLLGTTVLGSVQTSFTSKRLFDVQSESENLIRNQTEYVFEQDYVLPVGVYLTVTPPSGFTVTADALLYDATSTGISTVRVTVYHEGELVKTFETLRTDR